MRPGANQLTSLALRLENVRYLLDQSRYAYAISTLMSLLPTSCFIFILLMEPLERDGEQQTIEFFINAREKVGD